MEISKLSELEQVWSPAYVVQGTPWKVRVSRNPKATNAPLQLFVYCAAEDKPENWTHGAKASINLHSFDGTEDSIEHQIKPYVFKKNWGFGVSLFKWDDFLAAKNSFVKNDSINLEITIEAADPDEENKSILLIEDLTEDCYKIKKRLTISNINNLMALQLPSIDMQKLPFFLTVYKHPSGFLSVRLMQPSQEYICDVAIRAKLISSNDNIKAIERVKQTHLRASKNLLSMNLMTWDELVKPENGFVQDNSAVIEVEIESKIIADLLHSRSEPSMQAECANPPFTDWELCEEISREK